MIGLALATVRERRLSLAGAFAALTVGAALSIGAGAVLAAADSAVGDEPGRSAAAPIVVTAPLGTAEEPFQHRAAVASALAARIEALPQVRRVVRDRAVIVRVNGAAIVARPWSARLGERLLSGRAPSAPGEVVSARSLSSVVTPAGPQTVRVVGRVSDGVFFSDEEAARLAPRVEAVAVWPRSGRRRKATENANEEPVTNTATNPIVMPIRLSRTPAPASASRSGFGSA